MHVTMQQVAPTRPVLRRVVAAKSANEVVSRLDHVWRTV